MACAATFLTGGILAFHSILDNGEIENAAPAFASEIVVKALLTKWLLVALIAGLEAYLSSQKMPF